MSTYGITEQATAKNAIFTSLVTRPTAGEFGIGRCQVGSNTYNSDGTTWTPVGIRTYTWATLPTPVLFDKGEAFVSDLGVHGTTLYSDGTTWSVNNPIVLAQTATPGWLVPSMPTGSAATYSQTAYTITVTGTHVIPATVHNGKSVYLVLSGGTAVTGWFTNFTYVSGSSFTCTSTISQSDTGNVVTNISETQLPAVTTVVPGNLMGVNGVLKISADFTTISSGNLKTFTGYFDSQAFSTVTATTSVYMGLADKPIRNRGSAASQYTTGLTWQSAANSASAPVALTVNTALDKSVTFSVTLSTASEFIALSGLDITLFRA